MPNTNLPENVVAGQNGRIDDINTAWSEINELSRSTGLRDITALLANGWTATGVRIERVRDHIHFYWRGLNGSAATSNALITFGAGEGDVSNRFAPMGGSHQTELHMDDAGEVYRLRAIATNIQVPSSADRRDLGGYWKMTTWRTGSNLWPSTLPGVSVVV